MRIWLLIAFLLPATANAAESAPTNDWHICQTDEDCMLAKAPCGQFAVNRNYQSVAETYHAAHDDPSHCKNGSLYTKPNGARCSYESCSAVYN